MEWKAIPGYEGQYEVSTDGDVRSLAFMSKHTRTICLRKTPHILSPETTHDGYKRVVLSKGGVKQRCSVHRLVALAFIPNPDNLPQVNHLDENPANNNVRNLAWCTGKENCNHGSHRQRIVEFQTNNPKRSKPVCQYDRNNNFIASYPSTREAQRQTGIASEQISRVCMGKNHHAGGFLWKYAEKTNDYG